jgi:hypothetical protein
MIKPSLMFHAVNQAGGRNIHSMLVQQCSLTPFDLNTPGTFTATNVACLFGVETQEGNVIVSKETWARIETLVTIFDFMGETKRYEQKLQPTVARTGKSEVAGAEESTAGGNREAGLLPEMRQTLPEEETTGASP